MPTYNVKVIYEFELEAKDEIHAEERAYERMEDCNPRVDIEELEEIKED